MQHINKSLLMLGTVMSALATSSARSGAFHVPYRDSKLTFLLQQSLGGNCRTNMIVCLSPSAEDVSESASTADFGSRAMQVRCGAVRCCAAPSRLRSASLARARAWAGTRTDARNAGGGQALEEP